MLPELVLSLSSIPLISSEPDLPQILVKMVPDNSMDCKIVWSKFSNKMDSLDYIKDSVFPSSELSLIEEFTSEPMTQEKFFFSTISKLSPFCKNSCMPNS